MDQIQDGLDPLTVGDNIWHGHMKENMAVIVLAGNACIYIYKQRYTRYRDLRQKDCMHKQCIIQPGPKCPICGRNFNPRILQTS